VGNKLVNVGIFGAVAGIGFAAGTIVTQQVSGAPTVAAPAPIVSTANPVTNSLVTNTLGPNFIADAAEKVAPAVVRIDTERLLKASSRTQVDQFFFPDFSGGGSGSGKSRQPRTERGAGSGFIVSADGTILTNAHVVEGADKVTVTLNDGRRLTGKVLGKDTLTDLAVVKVDAGSNLPTIALGDSDKLRPGEFVIAVGNPLGLDHSVTAGIVSALNRTSDAVGVRGDRRLEFIQTDAAINPGNSGGPLINIYGDVVGINTAIRADGQGIGFAIPSNKVKSITDSLIKNGRISRPFIGVSMVTINQDLLDRLKEDPNSGALPDANKGIWIQKVVPKSPADKAGIRAEDVIVEVDGKSVLEARQVQELIGSHKVGESVALKVKRRDRFLTLEIKTVEYQEQPVS
jgi:serine protease Do